MGNFKTIFLKEFKDIIRDRRTMIMMVALPALLYPVLILIATPIIKGQMEDAKKRVFKVGVVGQQTPALFTSVLDVSGPYRITKSIPDSKEEIEALIQSDSLDAVFAFPSNFEENLAGTGKLNVPIYYQSTNEDAKNKVGLLTGVMDSMFRNQRLANLGIDRSILSPVQFKKNDLASSREIAGEEIGAMLPYFFFIFCFLGCMYPAIDLGAGEKERGTMETLLTTPASRLEIFLGKFAVVAMAGIISALIAIISLGLSIKLSMDMLGEIPPEVKDVLMSIIGSNALLLLLLLLIPLAVFFASAMLTASISARSFKEAQSMISPMMIVIMIPSIIAFMPSMHLSLSNAWIPLLNVSLAAKDIIAGTIEPLPYMITFVSLIIVAAGGMMLSLQFFKNERNVLA